ncbi:unnamed protein product, partial [marine sediment metagenome]
MGLEGKPSVFFTITVYSAPTPFSQFIFRETFVIILAVAFAGVLDNSNADTHAFAELGAGTFNIGYVYSSYGYVSARMDEARVSLVQRNVSWIKTSYNTMRFPDLFAVYGEEKTYYF